MQQRLLAVLMAALLMFSGVLSGCASADNGSEAEQSELESTAGVSVLVGSLKGPTSIGLVNFMDTAAQGSTELQNDYDFTIFGTADELSPLLISGDLDIALVPANLAATLYTKTEGEILVMDINTLGVLYVVSGDDSITSLDDLAGRTILMTGKGTTPDYVFNYLLEQSGLSGSVTLEFKSEATEVAAALAADPQAVAVLPEPFVTSIGAKDASIEPRISLTEAWEEVAAANGDDSQLVTGVTVVRKAFADEYPEVVQEFIAQQNLSVEKALSDNAATAELVVAQGILDSAQVAQQAIPRCNLTCITGQEMKLALEGYLQVLFSYDASSVGGSMPGADFYYN